jgi:hypothetical protein
MRNQVESSAAASFFTLKFDSAGRIKQALIPGPFLMVRWSRNREAGVLGLLRSRQRIPMQYQTRQQSRTTAPSRRRTRNRTGLTPVRSGGLVRERRKESVLVRHFPI